MPLYVGVKHEAVFEGAYKCDFRCKTCGYAAKTVSLGVGRGVGNSPYFLDDDGAEMAAQMRASLAAEANARSVVRFVRCPRCGWRNNAALAWFFVKSAILLALTAGLFFGAAWIFWDSHFFVSVVLLVGGIALLPVVYWQYLRPKHANADDRVVFLDTPKGSPKGSDPAY